MKNTFDNFLKALQMFRDNFEKQDMSVMSVITQYIVDFISDKDNKLYVLTDKEHHPLTIELDGGQCMFTYTSLEEFNKAHAEDGYNYYYIDNAYSLFEIVSGIKDYSTISIDDGTKPNVFIPKDILGLMVLRVKFQELTKNIKVVKNVETNELLVEESGWIIGKYISKDRKWVEINPYCISNSDPICNVSFEYVISQTAGILPVGFHRNKNID